MGARTRFSPSAKFPEKRFKAYRPFQLLHKRFPRLTVRRFISLNEVCKLERLWVLPELFDSIENKTTGRRFPGTTAQGGVDF